MKLKFFLLALAVAFLCTVQPVQAQGKGHQKQHDKEYKPQRYYGRDGYSYRRGKGDDDDDQGGRRHYYRSNNGGYYRSLPPGQAKKVYGYQSAKYFAPGQQKKQYRNDDNRYYYNQGYSRSNVLTNVLGSLLGY